MYQIDTSLTLYTLKQIDSVLVQSNALFIKMVDETIALNEAILNFEPLELTSNVNLDWMFPSIKTAAQKEKLKKPRSGSICDCDSPHTHTQRRFKIGYRYRPGT